MIEEEEEKEEEEEEEEEEADSSMYKSVHFSKILSVRGSFHSSGSSKDSVFRLFSPAFHRNRPFHDLWKELSLFSKLDFLPSFYLLEEKFVEDYSIYSLNFLFNNSILHEYFIIFIDLRNQGSRVTKKYPR